MTTTANGEAVRVKEPIECKVCGCRIVWRDVDELDEHLSACHRISMGLLAEQLAPPAPLPGVVPVSKRVLCQVCAGTQKARAHDERVGKPAPDCWACGGTGWFTA